MRLRRWVWMKGGATQSVPDWNASVINGNNGRSRGMRRIYKLWYTDNHTEESLMFDHWRRIACTDLSGNKVGWIASFESRFWPPRDSLRRYILFSHLFLVIPYSIFLISWALEHENYIWIRLFLNLRIFNLILMRYV